MARKPHLAAMATDDLLLYEERLWSEVAAVTAERTLRKEEAKSRADQEQLVIPVDPHPEATEPPPAS